MRWLEIAWEQEGAGVAEIGGPRASASVIAYFHQINRPDITSDEVPWCAAFYFWCLMKAGIDVSGIPEAERLLAWSATKLGQRISEPRVGCGCVMRRVGGHHVGFVAKWTATTVTLLGGNQADSVCERTFKRTPDMIFMWPEPATPKTLEAAGSRIVASAAKVRVDAAKATTAQVVPAPPAFEPSTLVGSAPAPADALPPPDVIVHHATSLQGWVETAMQFSTFVAGKWTWVMGAVAVYYVARIAWNSSLIRRFRAEDAATGKTIGAGGVAGGSEAEVPT